MPASRWTRPAASHGRADARRRPCSSAAGVLTALGVSALAIGVSALALGVASPAAAAMAESPDLPPPTATDSLLRSAGNPLALSDAQRERIEQIVSESREYAELLKSELADAQTDLRRRLDGPDPDFDAVMREVDRVGELETRLRKHRIATLMSVRALLSPDQRAGLAKIFRMASHHGHPEEQADNGATPGTTSADASPTGDETNDQPAADPAQAAGAAPRAH